MYESGCLYCLVGELVFGLGWLVVEVVGVDVFGVCYWFGFMEAYLGIFVVYACCVVWVDGCVY